MKEIKIRFCEDECGNNEHFMRHICCRDCIHVSTCKDRCDMFEELEEDEECDMEED